MWKNNPLQSFIITLFLHFNSFLSKEEEIIWIKKIMITFWQLIKTMKGFKFNFFSATKKLFSQIIIMTNKPDIASLTALKTQLKDWTLKKEFSTQIEEESTKLPEDKTFKLPEDEEGKEELKKLRNWNETLDRQKELSISVYNEMITSVCEIILLTNELEIISASLELIDKCINNGWPVFDAFALE
ncbi:hypothetical protein RFI_37578, partial [Reticulomyxa filosa]